MGGTIAQRLETVAGTGAAASLAAALGFAIYQVALTFCDLPVSAAAAGASAFVAFPAARGLLRALEGQPKPFAQPDFDVPAIAVTISEELVLTDADKLQPAPADEPLELDDVLVEIAQDSRVVQLFDPAAMPTPGQLQARIDRHLRGGTSHSPPPDASDVLFAALADLRRSLR
jgi:hypothetical protein